MKTRQRKRITRKEVNNNTKMSIPRCQKCKNITRKGDNYCGICGALLKNNCIKARRKNK